MPTHIESLDNPKIKAAARLLTRRGRSTQSRILIHGVREILRAAEGGVEFLEVYRRVEIPNDEATQAAWDAAAESAARTCTVSDRVLQRISYGERDEGIVAVAQRPRRSLADWSVDDESLLLVLDNLEKPGNVGAIFRTADAVGVNGVILSGGSTDPYNPNAIRASLGTVFTTPALESESQTLEWLRARSFRIFAARIEGATDYNQVQYDRRTAIVLGSEARGVTDIWRQEDIIAVSLPMRGAADSLNVSVTAAVLCYEALRQRAAP